jgi:hypothetical protein
MNTVSGDILDSDCQAVVIPVNCEGVAGAGLALACRVKYPDWFRAYRDQCLDSNLCPGVCHWFAVKNQAGAQYLVSLPTKVNWRETSRLAWVEQGLLALRRGVEQEPWPVSLFKVLVVSMTDAENGPKLRPFILRDGRASFPAETENEAAVLAGFARERFGPYVRTWERLGPRAWLGFAVWKRPCRDDVYFAIQFAYGRKRRRDNPDRPPWALGFRLLRAEGTEGDVHEGTF